MGLFDNMLKDYETLFRDPIALDYDYMPKLIPYRENEQKQVASCIQPLFQKRNGRNILVHGQPGVGKTVAIRNVLRELEEQSDEVIPIYVNCWQKNTTYKIIIELCNKLNYKFTQNKKTDELFKIVKEKLNRTCVVFCFDEVDKLEDVDFIYYLLEEIYRKTIILVTNYKEWHTNLDERIKSRLMAEMLEFRQYNREETKGILKERMKYAFNDNVFTPDAFEAIVEKTAELGDIRSGLYLLRESATIAEGKAEKKVSKENVNQAIEKLNEFFIKKKEELTDETQFILQVINENKGKRIGEIYKAYQEKGGKMVYKTFQRHIKKLADNKFISIKKITGGAEGTTTYIDGIAKEKKLDEF